MEELDLILQKNGDVDRYFGKLRKVKDNFILKIYEHGIMVKKLRYVGESTNTENVKYREII